MRNNKSRGENNVTAEAIKLGGPVLIANIQKLFNLYLNDLTFSFKWNNAVILPYKKGDKTCLENWRPISLLSDLYELFTRVLTTRLEAIMDFYQPRKQAGFR